tara:strand:- start:21061 stop:21243 length:183 start_codon:yes stop_codon:yes gene_type:complete
MANVFDRLLDLFLTGKTKKTKNPAKKKSSAKGKKVAKIKATAKKKNVIKNYVGRKPKSRK